MNPPQSNAVHRVDDETPTIADVPTERVAEDAGPALDWFEARQGSGLESPDELPDGDTHLNIDRTFVFADLSGFTQYTRENGPHEAVKLLGEFRRVTRNVAAKRGVRVAKWLGDGVMIVSVEPEAAVAFGAHLIHHFAPTALQVRVGIASGIALLFEGDDYIGEPVNLAAKLCAAANPDEILGACDTDHLPDWVEADRAVAVSIKGVGVIGDIYRLVPVTDRWLTCWRSSPIAKQRTDLRGYKTMELFVTDDAANLIRKKGGVIAIDFVPPIGWGRTKYDVSVDMHLKGKNLAPYRIVRHDGMKIHVAPKLMGYARAIQLDLKGAVRKKIEVDIDHEHGPNCNH